MKRPQDGHPITIEPNPDRVVVRLGGRTVADTRNALRLREATLPPVDYIPLDDVDTDLLERTEHRTHCPYNGDASHWTIRVGDRVEENAVWGYESPFPEVAAIRGHLAFYANRVEVTGKAPD